MIHQKRWLFSVSFLLTDIYNIKKKKLEKNNTMCHVVCTGPRVTFCLPPWWCGSRTLSSQEDLCIRAYPLCWQVVQTQLLETVPPSIRGSSSPGHPVKGKTKFHPFPNFIDSRLKLFSNDLSNQGRWDKLLHVTGQKKTNNDCCQPETPNLITINTKKTLTCSSTPRITWLLLSQNAEDRRLDIKRNNLAWDTSSLVSHLTFNMLNWPWFVAAIYFTIHLKEMIITMKNILTDFQIRIWRIYDQGVIEKSVLIYDDVYEWSGLGCHLWALPLV